MFNMELISKLLEQLFMATLPVVAVFVVKYLLSKIDDAKTSAAAEQRWVIQFAVNMAVKAAEQIYGAGNGVEKKNYAIDAAQAYLNGYGFNIDVQALDAAIESEVFSTFNSWFEDIDE